MTTVRLLAFAALVASTACSQRAPWRVIPAAPAGPTVSQSATPRADAPAAATPAPLATVAAAPSDATTVAHLRSLYFPIAAGDSIRLDDSFDAPRDGGVRKHQAIDILAPRGTPVLSAGDGRILRLSKSAKGGITVYATDLEEQFVYYYAHLDRYHASVYAGKPLMRGDTLGYVGTTGNSPANVPHLHFQIMHMPADRKFWNGAPVNPYPLLKSTGSAQAAQAGR
ncbi:MAG TPA: M23 family metallopeptidase [Gemmatimonadaceae bacterium]|nr:M23 family metallopeptidase [Gemmatimonadaceae bacterium]